MRHGTDIRRYPVKERVDTGITYHKKYDEYNACAFFHLDFERWVLGEYPTWIMAEAVAHYKLKQMVSIHVEDARNRKKK